MKTAIYIEDGVTQLVLTPETDYEKGIVSSFGDRLSCVEVFNGTFYDCRGGWVRQSAMKHKGSPYSHSIEDDCSLIMKLSRLGRRA